MMARVGDLNICHMEVEDASKVAEIHRESIGSGFLSSLGITFLKVLYRSMAQSPHAFVLVVKDRESVKGFVSGTTNLSGFYRDFLKKHFWEAVISLLPVLTRPKNVKRILETLFYPKKNDELPEAELLSIAVEKDLRGSGAPYKLFSEFKREMEKRGVGEFKVVVGASNLRANRFYEKVGFTLRGEIEVHRGEKSKVWIYKLERGD